MKSWWIKKQCQWFGHRRWKMCGVTYYSYPSFTETNGKLRYCNLCWRCGASVTVGEFYLAADRQCAEKKT